MDLTPKALLFDKDGTLFDFTLSWANCTARVINHFAQDDAEKCRRICASAGFDMTTRTFHPDSVVIAGTMDEAVAALVAGGAGEKAEVATVLFREVEQADMTEACPLAPLMDRFRATGLKLGVVTNDAEVPAKAHLTRAGVLDRFDFVAGYDSGYGAKPDAGPCSAFARAMGVPPAQVVMVGDSLHDLHAGRSAGMHTVGVLTGIATKDDLAPHADAVLPSIADLPRWLDLPEA